MDQLLTSGHRYFKKYSSSISQGAVSLAVNTIGMLLVEMNLGNSGLGMFTFILSVYFILGYISEFGIPCMVERDTALYPDSGTAYYYQAKSAMRVPTMGICAILIIVALSGISSNGINDASISYLILAISIPIRNTNKLKLAIIQGKKHHVQAAALKTKKYFFYLCVLLITLRPVYHLTSEGKQCFFALTLCLLIPELIQGIQLLKDIRLPSPLSYGFQISNGIRLLKTSRKFLFSENAFDVILYIDFLVLGFFVSAHNVGIYAEATILARVFILIPSSIKTIVRNQYCSLSASGRKDAVVPAANKTAQIIFYITALLGLYMLFYFPSLFHFLFNADGSLEKSFEVFKILFPGLLYLGVSIIKEPIYEASEQQDILEYILIAFLIMNLALNFYLIPYAGIKGAASASTLSFIFFFIMLNAKINRNTNQKLREWLIAGAWVLCIYMISQKTQQYPIMTFFVLPPVLFICFYFSGFFDNKTVTNSPI